MKTSGAFEILTSDPVELSIITLKGRMMILLTKMITEAGMSQAQAAKILKVSQPRVSNLMGGKMSKFSIDMLIEMLGRMGCMIDADFDLSAESPIKFKVRKSAV